MGRIRADRRRLSITLSRSLSHALELAREKTGRSLSAEIEAQLRRSLRRPTGDGLLLLEIDEGLYSWLCALHDGGGFFGRDLPEAVIYLIRRALHEELKHDVWFAAAVPKLPSPLREHLMATPQWQNAARKAAADPFERWRREQTDAAE